MFKIKTNLYSVEVCDTPCDFPFTYNGTQYNKCITNDNDGIAWCENVYGEKSNCTPACPGNIMVTMEKHALEAENKIVMMTKVLCS